ncbi:uncharacterized protein [Paramisgurnus dabryanus]|uniref:uncharacterized protein n=1 Tax=Paramisgurnus dabryanus TaxID=90735 RepID=UPI0031F33B54
MKCDHKKFILLLSFAVYLILKVESKHDKDITVNVISGDNVTAYFTFKDSGINSTSIPLNLYKNGKKIGSCKQTNKNCFERFVISDVDDNNTATLYIINITSEDDGKYHIGLFADAYYFKAILSNKIFFTVKPCDKTNESSTTSVPKTTVNDSLKPEETSVQTFIYISASALMFICIFVGLLCWFHRTCPRKSATDNPQAQSNGTTQGDFGRSGGVSVSCVEYGELDFQNRPARDDRVKHAEVTSKDQDSVEYAAIIFPQQKQIPGGRMRDNQRAHPVTR